MSGMGMLSGPSETDRGYGRETHRVDEGRLTDLDYARIDDTVGARCADLVAEGYGLSGDALGLTRLAHHSIGCSAADLRDVELGLIDQQVAAIVAFYSLPRSQRQRR